MVDSGQAVLLRTDRHTGTLRQVSADASAQVIGSHNRLAHSTTQARRNRNHGWGDV